MNRENQLTVARFLPEFFCDHLIGQRSLSPNTVSSYGCSWRLFLLFWSKRHKRPPSKLKVSELDVEDVLAFLDSVERERSAGAKTRNLRLSGIRSAVKYALARDPALPVPVQAIMSIPRKKAGRRSIGFLEQAEVDALLQIPDTGRWSDRRDRIMFETLYNTGARVSEITAVLVSDVRLERNAGQIRLHGKGRKERVLPLWKDTARHLREWIRDNRLEPSSPLFPNARGGRISRSGVERRLKRALSVARGACASLDRQGVSPHVLRHTTAMHMHDAGVEMSALAMWLGHESIETTNIYLSTSMERKEQALSKLQPPGVKSIRFKAEDALIEFLDGL
jgi:site-specific recombinase XerD